MHAPLPPLPSPLRPSVHCWLMTGASPDGESAGVVGGPANMIGNMMDAIGGALSGDDARVAYAARDMAGNPISPGESNRAW
jgi:hypothetical protein